MNTIQSTTTANNFYPGMVDNHYELFHYQDELKVLNNGNIFGFDDLPESIINHIADLLDSDDQAMDFIHFNHVPVNASNPAEIFAYCRFGGLDFTPDLKVSCVEGDTGVIEIQDGEYWDCPMASSCSGRGILCKMPVYKGYRLTPTDVDVMKLLKTNLTNESIAHQLEMPMGSLHLLKKNLYKNLGNLQTRQEVTLVASFLNIN